MRSCSKVQILCTNALRAVIACGSKIIPESAGIVEYNSLRKIHPHLHNALSNENVKWYYRDTSYKRLAHSVTSSRATLPFESAWICIATERTF